MTYRIALLATLLVPFTASAAETRLELETDVIAPFLKGGSLHAAVTLEHTRLDIGVFTVETPEFFHGNDGFELRSVGGTVKWDYTGTDPNGFFVGLEANLNRLYYTERQSGQEGARWEVTVGPRAGYRFALGSHWYIVPWIGVGYVFNGAALTLNGRTVRQNDFTFFPTVHLGYRF